MSLNEIAVDLTCESAEFEPASTEEEEVHVPGRITFPSQHISPSSSSFSQLRYHVHSGMLRMARAMGDIGKPVQLAVLEALHRNPDYGSRCVYLCPAPYISCCASKQSLYYADTVLALVLPHC
jgi:sn1-specific diacylglycerol lipase